MKRWSRLAAFFDLRVPMGGGRAADSIYRFTFWSGLLMLTSMLIGHLVDRRVQPGESSFLALGAIISICLNLGFLFLGATITASRMFNARRRASSRKRVE